MALYADPFNPQGQTFQDIFYGQNPDLAYRKHLQGGGVDEYSPFGRFAQNQQGSLYSDYSLRSLNKPATYSFTQDLEENGGIEGLRRRFRGLPPEQRGLNVGRFAGPVRYVGF
jgi:hypothetical protein